MSETLREKAQAAFASGMACSQAVATTFAERLGLDEETVAKMALGFGGGMGRQGRTCGAVTGAYMVLGLARGEQTEGKWNKDEVYALVRDFTRRFVAAEGDMECRGLLGHDISDADEYAKAREQGVFGTVCPEAVGMAAEILEQILDEKER